MELTTDNKKRRRSSRRRRAANRGSSGLLPSGLRDGSVESGSAYGTNKALEEALTTGGGILGPASPGAPIARAHLTSRAGAPSEPGAPINLASGIKFDQPAHEVHHQLDGHQFDGQQFDGQPGGRRSRAFAAPQVNENPQRALTVVDGGSDFDIEDDEASASRSLSPSTASALGDFAAAMAGPLAGAIYLQSVAVFIGSALLVLLVRSQVRRSALTEGEVSGFSPVVAAAGVFVLALAVDWSAGIGVAASAAIGAACAGIIAAVILKLVTDKFVHVRIAVVGEAATAHDLAWQLSREGIHRYTVVGYVTRTGERDNLRDLDHVSFKVRRLGLLSDLSHIVARNDIELLVMGADQDRLKVFERAAVCAERYRTRLVALTAFEEAVFRRVPVDQVNVAWFQHIMHPRFRPPPRIAVRTIDLTVAALIGLITAPIWLFTAAFVKVAFGAPVLVRRRRVGERGRSFSILRFRVAPTDEHGDQPAEDANAVGFGRFLRLTHIEALPQLLNVLRGDLSLVGPEPQAPQFVAEVENDVQFYGRRHLVRPGLFGWAQLHRRDDDSDDAETTLSNDLFYLKHQSMSLYLYVLLAAVWSGLTGSHRARAS